MPREVDDLLRDPLECRSWSKTNVLGCACGQQQSLWRQVEGVRSVLHVGAEPRAPGRADGIRTLLESRYNLTGKYNDDVTKVSATRTRALKQDPSTFGEFKVPSLRNLALSHPYGRDGQVNSLVDVVRHYSEMDPIKLHARDGRPAKPLELTAREQSDLVVFLESLSTFTNPWRPDDHGDCL